MKDRIRKIIPALDITDLNQIVNMIEEIDHLPVVYGYKIGFSLGLTHGLPEVVRKIRTISEKPLIYDHQKAATDIPDTGKLFAQTMKDAGIDEVILFPQAGPETLGAWVEAINARQLRVIVGGIMTHPKFVVSEGGFIRDEAVIEIYRLAFEKGVRAFVVPLTKPEATKKVYETADLSNSCVFYSPGYGKQGGDPRQFKYLTTHYLIIGRSLLKASDRVGYLNEVAAEIKKF